MTTDELKEFFINKARIAMNEGSTFGEEGAGFMRMNIGCPLSTLKQALNQLLAAYKDITEK
jgi:cystathionine beta-lyase